MKTCKACKQEKELILFAKSKTCKDGYDTTCKQCRKEQSKERKNNRNKKSKQNLKVGFINPTHPIPVKKTSEDGYGGKWKFDIEGLKKDNGFVYFARSNGQLNHMSKSRIPCWQINTTELDKLKVFCFYIEMNEKAIIEFPKSDKTVYVVNLYHKNILQVMR